MDDLDRLAADLEAAGRDVVRRGRGVTAKHVNTAADRAKAKALASWTTYGRGEAGSAGTIRPRMSRDRGKILGYILADGDGAFFAEHGKSDRAPDPVMSQSAEAEADSWAASMSDLLADLL